jgi:two-component system sensor histidine kinase UhpB
MIERLAASRSAPEGDPGARIRQAWLATGVAAATIGIFLVELYGGTASVDASLYVIPVVMTLWLRGSLSTIVFTGVSMLLGATAFAATTDSTADAISVIAYAVSEAGVLVAAALTVVLRKRADARAMANEREWRDLADAAPVLIRAVEADGRTVYASRGWLALLGGGSERSVGRAWAVPAPAQADLEGAARDAAAGTHAALENEFSITAVDGRDVWILERVTPHIARDGSITGYLGFGIDVTARRAAEQSVTESRARLAEAERIAQLGHADVVVDRDARPVWSEGLFRLLAVEPGGIEPSIEAFLGYVVPEDRDALRGAIRAARTTGRWNDIEFRVRRADGEVRVLRAVAKIIADRSGEVARVFSTLQDVTARVEMERALVEHRNSLAKAQQLANLGSWSFDPASGGTIWSEQMTKIFGVGVESLPLSVEDFVEKLVHPEDRTGFTDGWARALAERVPVANEYRIIRPGGEERVVRAQCEFVADGIEGRDAMIGTCQDVTEARAAEVALRESEERFHLAARGANDGIWDWPDVDGDDLWLSTRYFELLGYEPGEFRPCGKIFNEQIVHPEDLQRNLDAVAHHLVREGPYDVEIRLKTKAGESRWFRMRGQAIFARDGRPIRMAGSMQDVHARKQAEQQVEEYQEQLRSLAYGAVLAAERERRRIGVELHDRTIQNLGLTSIKLSELKDRVELNGGAALFEQIHGLIKSTIQDTRALLAEISPPVLYELGFEAAVEWLAEQASTGAGRPRCVVRSDGLAKPLGENGQVVLFQAVRELLTNVGKHARATEVRVAIDRDGDSLRVEVFDDGVGFDPACVEPPSVSRGGFGLFSIRERLRLLGGVMEIESRAGLGTRVVLTAPLDS